MTTSTGEGRGREPAADQPRERAIPADTFAARLMLARHHAGHLSIREAADLCGVGRGAWTKWERGTRPVDILDVVQRIAERLDVDESWLLFGGQLTGSRGRPVAKRPQSDTHRYRVPAVRPGDNRPAGRAHPQGSPSQPTSGRRAARIGQPVSA